MNKRIPRNCVGCGRFFKDPDPYSERCHSCAIDYDLDKQQEARRRRKFAKFVELYSCISLPKK